jgi:hypothetical protein
VNWAEYTQRIRAAYGDSETEFADRMQRTGMLGEGISAASPSTVEGLESGRIGPSRRYQGVLDLLADEAPDRSRRLIVSRHPAAIEFLRAELGADWADVPAMASAMAEDVADTTVAGNLPLHLAALAAEVICVEFSGDAPRGTEYGVAEMRQAGARLRRYRVEALG